MTERTRWAYATISNLVTQKSEIYKVNGRQITPTGFRELLNEMGAEGWELVTAEQLVNERAAEVVRTYILKRPE